MAFDPTRYKVPTTRPLPVVLLLDVSGSMSYDEKIEKLYDSVVEMVDSFVNQAIKETVISISIITFGAEVLFHTPFTSVVDLKDKGIDSFRADGSTPLGMALKMLKDMIEDKAVTPSNAYRPAIVLVSDGVPTDEWKEPLHALISEGRSSKCQRFAIAIGNDADRGMLAQFTGNERSVFFAENASEISDMFSKVTMSVSMRSKSLNPNIVEDTNSTSVQITAQSEVDEDDDDDPF